MTASGALASSGSRPPRRESRSARARPGTIARLGGRILARVALMLALAFAVGQLAFAFESCHHAATGAGVSVAAAQASAHGEPACASHCAELDALDFGAATEAGSPGSLPPASAPTPALAGRAAPMTRRLAHRPPVPLPARLRFLNLRI